MAVTAAAAPLAALDARPRYRFVVEALLFLTYAAFGLSWIAVTPLMPELGQALAAGKAELALLNTAVTAAKVVAPLVAGWVALRLGLRRTILAGAVAIVAGGLLPLVDSLAAAVAARFVFGFGGAIVVTLMGPAVMQWFASDELPLVNGLNNVAANTGVAITLFATVPLAERLGWRRTLLLYAAVNLLAATAWALFGAERGGARRATTARPTVRLGEVLARRETWLITLAFMAPLALYLAVNTWLPSHYQEAFGLPRAAASRLTGLINLVGIPAAIAGGVLTRLLGRRRPFLVGAGLAVALGGAGVVLSHDADLRSLAAVTLGVGFFIAAAPLFTLAMELPGMTPAHAGVMFGVVFSGAYLVSSLSPLVVGWLRDALGSYTVGLLLWCALSSALALAGLLLPETGRLKGSSSA